MTDPGTRLGLPENGPRPEEERTDPGFRSSRRQTSRGLAGDRIAPELAHLEVLRLLAEGGMGAVHLARDERLGRDVVVKTIRRRYLGSPEMRARFLREAKILSSLRHPSICQIHEYVEGRVSDYLVLEYIEGRTLKQALAERDLAPKERLRIAVEIAEVLEVAHQAGVVHRDLKPGNLMLDVRGRVKVLDFGVAHTEEEGETGWETRPVAATREETGVGSSRTASGTSQLTTVGSVLGTPAFMSPEQARGEPVGPSSDVYSFGLVLQELLASNRPHPEGLKERRLLDRARVGMAEAPEGVGRGLRQLILRMRDTEPARRPTATEVVQSLRRHRDRPRRLARWGVALAVVGALTVGAAKYAVDLRQERREVAAARAEAEDLINFLLEDLFAALEPLGRTELLREVAERVEGYYRRLPEERRSDSPGRVVRALRHVGVVYTSQGRADVAAAVLDEADRLATRAATRSSLPTAERGEILGERGRVRLARARLDGASENLEAAIGRLQDALRDLEAAPGRERDRAEVLEELGLAEQDRLRLDAASRRFEESRFLREELLEVAPSSPVYRAELGVVWERIGDVDKVRGRPAEAMAAYERARELLESAVDADPHHAEWTNELAMVWDDLGDLHLDTGDVESARAAYVADLVLARRLASDDPTNRERQLALTYPLTAVAEVDLLGGRPEAAAAPLAEAETIIRELLSLDSRNASWEDRLAETLELRGLLEEERERWDDALDAHLAALEIRRRLVARDPQHEFRRRELASSLVRGGVVLGALGRDVEGRAMLGESLQIIGTDHAEDVRFARSRAEALLQLGRDAEASPVLDFLRRTGPEDPRNIRLLGTDESRR